MRLCHRRVCVVACGIWAVCGSLEAGRIVDERFSGYLQDALISASPAGPAVGLTGDWALDSESDFYVNRTQLDLAAGSGKAVYDRPSNDNGSRIATRATSKDHVLFENDGDVFYASFLIAPGRSSGDMTFELELNRINGGGALDCSFGIIGGAYAVGNGGVDVDASGATATAVEQLVVLRIEYGDSGTGGPSVAEDEELITIWVDPVGESSPAVLDAVSTDFLSRGGGKLTAVSIRGDKMSGQPAFFDNLWVGTSFESVSLAGDFDRDRAVSQSDLTLLLSNWGETTQPEGWTGPWDGLVDQNELTNLLMDWGVGTTATSTATAVPEPGSIFLLCAGMFGLIVVCRPGRLGLLVAMAVMLFPCCSYGMEITKCDAAPSGNDVLIGFDTDGVGSQQFFPMGRGGGSSGVGGGETAYGQTFSFDANVLLDKITFKVRTTQDVSGVPLLLWFGTGYTGQLKSGLSSLILEPEAPLPSGMGVGGDPWYLTLDIEDQPLEAGRTYAFMPRFASGGSGGNHPEMEVGFMGRYAYDDGAAFTFDAGFGYNTILNNEMVFFLHGETIPFIGDFDLDGRVCQSDLTLLLSHWGSDDQPTEWAGPWDGQVDQNELTDLLSNWGAGSNTSAVPEPGATTLLVLALVLVVAVRRRI